MDTAPTTPANRIIARFGAQKLSAWTKRHRSRVYRWAESTEKGGTGGVIPHRARQAIVEGAMRDLGETVTAAEFEPQDGEGYLFGEGAAA